MASAVHTCARHPQLLTAFAGGCEAKRNEENAITVARVSAVDARLRSDRRLSIDVVGDNDSPLRAKGEIEPRLPKRLAGGRSPASLDRSGQLRFAGPPADMLATRHSAGVGRSARGRRSTAGCWANVPKTTIGSRQATLDISET